MKEEGKGAKYCFYEVMIPILKLGVYKQPCLDQETDLELTNLLAHNPDDLHSPFLHIYSVNLLELYEMLCTTKKLVKVPKCYREVRTVPRAEIPELLLGRHYWLHQWHTALGLISWKAAVLCQNLT